MDANTTSTKLAGIGMRRCGATREWVAEHERNQHVEGRGRTQAQAKAQLVERLLDVVERVAAPVSLPVPFDGSQWIAYPGQHEWVYTIRRKESGNGTMEWGCTTHQGLERDECIESMRRHYYQSYVEPMVELVATMGRL